MAEEWDVIVIGGGPAGLGAALYTARAMMRTVVFEKTVIGGQLAEAYEVDNYLGFDQGVLGADLVDKMRAHVEKFGARIVNAEVSDVGLDDRMKIVVTSEGEHRAPIVVCAAGASHRKLDVPGEDRLAGAGVSYCATCDGAFFKGMDLVVVGGGDAALTELAFLTRFARSIALIHRRQQFRAEAVHVAEVRKHKNVRFVLDTVVREVLGDKHVEGVAIENVKTGRKDRIDCRGVFVFVGHEPNTHFLKTVLPQYAGCIVPTDMNMETEIKGLYAVGDVRKGSYRQAATAVADGATAAMHAERRIEMLRQGSH